MKIQKINFVNGKQSQSNSAKNISFLAKNKLSFPEFLDIPEYYGTSYAAEATMYFPKSVQKEIEKIVKSIKGRKNSVSTEIGAIRDYMVGSPLSGDYAFLYSQASRVTSVIDGKTKTKIFFKEGSTRPPQIDSQEILNYLKELKKNI